MARHTKNVLRKYQESPRKPWENRKGQENTQKVKEMITKGSAKRSREKKKRERKKRLELKNIGIPRKKLLHQMTSLCQKNIQKNESLLFQLNAILRCWPCPLWQRKLSQSSLYPLNIPQTSILSTNITSIYSYIEYTVWQVHFYFGFKLFVTDLEGFRFFRPPSCSCTIQKSKIAGRYKHKV